MLHAYADVSMDAPIMSAGYVLYRTHGLDERLLDTGTRVINTNADDRDIEWCSNRGEYYAAIVAVRAALDYTTDPIVVCLDNEAVVKAIKGGSTVFEDYFPHALFSFLERFEDYHVRIVHRENNEAAHQQARVGLEVGRQIQGGVL